MILGFKDRFVQYVEDGSKTHTIRAGERWKVGMRADLFARPRQRGMRLIFRAPVMRIDKITITEAHRPGLLTVSVNDVILDASEADVLFWRDGFRDRTGETYQHTAQAWEFWRDRLPFDGQVIHWNYAERCFHMTRSMAQAASREQCLNRARLAIEQASRVQLGAPRIKND